MRHRHQTLLFLLGMVVLFTSCNTLHDKNKEDKQKDIVQASNPEGNFGDKITSEHAINAYRLPELLEGKESVETKIAGEITSVCQMTGCWMDIDMGNGKIVHVTFKEDSFVIPMDAAGKEAILQGVASYETLSVDYLKRAAEEEGKTKEEIELITEPDREYNFIANGVIIREK